MKAKLTIEQHLELGKSLKQVRDILIKCSCLIPSTYGKTSHLGKIAKKQFNSLEQLICEMDDQAFRDDGEEYHSGIYYGKNDE